MSDNGLRSAVDGLFVPPDAQLKIDMLIERLAAAEADADRTFEENQRLIAEINKTRTQRNEALEDADRLAKALSGYPDYRFEFIHPRHGIRVIYLPDERDAALRQHEARKGKP